MSSVEALHEYRPIRRIRQACQNCRRKKARCPGQKPECSFCQRLGQVCSYSEDGPKSPQSSGSQASPKQRRRTYIKRAAASTRGEAADLAAKISSMENQVAEVAQSVKSLETSLAVFSTHLAKFISNSTSQVRSAPKPRELESVATGKAAANPVPYIGLPPIDIIRSAADLYFRYCHNQPYSLFHESSFRDKIDAGEVPSHLLFALVANTVRYSTDPFFLDKPAAIAAYAQQSWKAIVMPWSGLQSDAELSIVQTILLLAIIDWTEGRTQASWIKVGLAIRLSQDFRLMVEPDPKLPATHQEERRRVFWSFYLCDKLISCGRERPAAILDDQCRLQLPSDENKWRAGEHHTTPILGELVDDASGTSLGKLSPFAVTILLTSLLGRSAQYALGEQEEQTSSGKLPPWNPRSKYSSIHSAILQHESELGLNEPLSAKIAEYCLAPDGTIDPHRGAPLAFSHALFFLCQCLLYHPFLLKQRLARVGQKTPQSFLTQNLNACHVAAISLSRLIGDVRQLQSEVLTTSYDSFYGYCNMVAGVIHAIFMGSKDHAVQKTAAACYDASLQNLKDLSLFWKSCAKMHARLEDFRASSESYSSLIDPTVQEMDLSADDTNDLIECMDYARMSSTQRRRSQSVASENSSLLLPTPYFDEMISLLPLTYSRSGSPGDLDSLFGAAVEDPESPTPV